MREHLTPVSTIKQQGSTESCKEVAMNAADALTSFVDCLNAPTFPTLEYFNASSTSEALKWTDLMEADVVLVVLGHVVC